MSSKLTRKQERKLKLIEKKQKKFLFFNGKQQVSHVKAPHTARKVGDVSIEAAGLLRRQEVEKNLKATNKITNRAAASNTAHCRGSVKPIEAETKVLSPRPSNNVRKINTETVLSKSEHIANCNIETADTNNLSNCCPNASKQQKAGAPLPSSRKLSKENRLLHQSESMRVKQLQAAIAEEDALIAKLEKKLKLNKTKDRHRLERKMFSDGLDYALELCWGIEADKKEQQGKHGDKPQQNIRQQNSKPPFTANGEQKESLGNENSLDSAVKQKQLSQTNDTLPHCKEDIYGRKRDKDGNIITSSGIYVPPHQRALMNAEWDIKKIEQMERLRSNIKGHLNRLSEANLHRIAIDIENLYMNNSRFNMNETLSKLFQEALIIKMLNKERFIQEHVVLLAYLHATIGSEIGAYFLQKFVEQYHQLMQQIADICIDDKRPNNIVLVLCYMYLFRIINCDLIFELIDTFLGNITEKTVECLILIFQSVGCKLHKDNPPAYTKSLSDLQLSTAKVFGKDKEPSRLLTTVEICLEAANNFKKNSSNFDTTLRKTLMKKLSAMLRPGKYVDSLSINMKDILELENTGKWWIVGSACIGQRKETEYSKQEINTKSVSETTKSDIFDRYPPHLQRLAILYKMNTKERRNIFCIVMNSEDYLDAFQKLINLGLKDKRSVAYVILQCCINEKTFNPYYAFLATKLCSFNRDYGLAFRFAITDRIEDMEDLNGNQVKIFANLLGNLLLDGRLPLTVLKVINFFEYHKANFALMRIILQMLLLTPEEVKLYQIFQNFAKNSKVKTFRQCMRVFLQHFLQDQHAKEPSATVEESTAQWSFAKTLTNSQKELIRNRLNNIDNMLAFADL